MIKSSLIKLQLEKRTIVYFPLVPYHKNVKETPALYTTLLLLCCDYF